MNIEEHKKLAMSLMEKYNVSHWRVRYFNRKTTFGQCRHRERAFYYSKYMVLLNSVERCTENILHEIAHALTPGAGHGYLWQKKAIELGIRPQRCWTSADTVAPKPKWQAMCHRHGKRGRYNRRGNLVCGDCRKEGIHTPLTYVINPEVFKNILDSSN